jgi:hypothetical protein
MTTTTNTATPAPLTGEAAMRAELDKLRAENEALKAKGKGGERALLFKVSEKKGALSIYGMGRFPVTLYKSQWKRLLTPDMVKAIETFIADNDASLKDKPE